MNTVGIECVPIFNCRRVSRCWVVNHLVLRQSPIIHDNAKGEKTITYSCFSMGNTHSKDPDLAYQRTRDGFIEGLKLVKATSEATALLGPLKAACEISLLFLETTRVEALGANASLRTDYPPRALTRTQMGSNNSTLTFQHISQH